MTGRFPMGEITGTWPDSASGAIGVLQASTAAPSMRIPHDPHTAMRQLLRYVTDPSTVSFTTSRTSRSVAVSGPSTVNSWSRPCVGVGVVALDLQGELHAAPVSRRGRRARTR